MRFDDLINQVYRHYFSIEHRLNELEKDMAEVSADQQHLDTDVQSLKGIVADFNTEVDGLKTQIANGTPAQSLDFAPLDALISGAQAQFPANPTPDPTPPTPTA